MKVVRINEQDIEELKELKEVLQKCRNVEDHCCGNCGRTFQDKGVLLCKFTKEETNPNDFCTHYI